MQSNKKYSVIDASYVTIAKYQKKLGIAANVVKDCLIENDLYDENSSTVMISCVHPSQARIIDRLRKKGYRCIIGGGGALSPGAFEHAYCIVLGDCFRFIKSLKLHGLEKTIQMENNIFDPQNPKKVFIDQSFPYYLSGKYKNESKEQVFFLSRGCKGACAFCHTRWSIEYSENPNPANIIEKINQCKCKSLMSNDIGSVSFVDELRIDGTAGSYRMIQLIKMKKIPRVVRIGVEGISERIRKAVSKSLSNQSLVDNTLTLWERGASVVRWFMICGFPGENAGDWNELKDCIRALNIFKRKGVLQISFTAFAAEPSTPMSGMTYAADYYDFFSDFKNWYFEIARNPSIGIMQPQGPEALKIKTEYQMHPNNMYVQYIDRELCKKIRDKYFKTMDIIATLMPIKQ